jgi:hypothetical protein
MTAGCSSSSIIVILVFFEDGEPIAVMCHLLRLEFDRENLGR